MRIELNGTPFRLFALASLVSCFLSLTSCSEPSIHAPETADHNAIFATGDGSGSLAKRGNNNGNGGGGSGDGSTQTSSSDNLISRGVKYNNGSGGTASVWMTVGDGGELTYMGHTVIVPPGALDKDKFIYITDVNSDLIQADYGPDGTFAKPVVIIMSYADADLTGINEDDLSMSWYDETNGVWINVGGKVNKGKKTVTIYTDHFTQYSLSIR